MLVELSFSKDTEMGPLMAKGDREGRDGSIWKVLLISDELSYGAA